MSKSSLLLLIGKSNEIAVAIDVVVVIVTGGVMEALVWGFEGTRSLGVVVFMIVFVVTGKIVIGIDVI